MELTTAALIEKPQATGTASYTTIPVQSLRLDSITNFDLYIRARPDEPPVLYAKRDLAFTQESLTRLRANGVKYLYVSDEQQTEYHQYLEKNLGAVLTDPRLNMKQKSGILYSTAEGLLEDVFSDPMLDEGLERSRDLVRNTVDFVFNEPVAMRHLIRTAASDYSMYTHSMNGCILGLGLARKSGINHPKRLRNFGIAAMLRDIGMTRVTTNVSEKTTKLTWTEFEDVKKHAQFSVDIIAEMGTLEEAELEIVLQHHERMDGSGYPRGLSGDDIDPMARILSIVDVFDALTTDRPYKGKISSFEAIQQMNQAMRGEFDPKLFKTFIDMMGNPS